MEQKQTADRSINQSSVHEEQPSTLPPAKYDKSEQWVQEYKKQFGTEPSFF